MKETNYVPGEEGPWELAYNICKCGVEQEDAVEVAK